MKRRKSHLTMCSQLATSTWDLLKTMFERRSNNIWSYVDDWLSTRQKSAWDTFIQWFLPLFCCFKYVCTYYNIFDHAYTYIEPTEFLHATNQNKIKLSCASSYADNRSWVVPRATDNTQNIFHLHIQNCASVNIRLSQLQAFASKHFSPIWLENFVKYLHRNLRRLRSFLSSILLSTAEHADTSYEMHTDVHLTEIVWLSLFVFFSTLNPTRIF